MSHPKKMSPKEIQLNQVQLKQFHIFKKQSMCNIFNFHAPLAINIRFVLQALGSPYIFW